jgi:hypothetical protein
LLHVDLPTRSEILAIASARSEPSVTIYLATTPLTEAAQADRIALKNLGREAIAQLEAAGTDKRSIWPIEAALEEVGSDDEFWAHQANSLALFITPDSLRTFRLPSRLTSAVHVSDRFHIKPLLRAVTFGQDAYVLAIGRGAVRLIEVSGDLPPHKVPVPGLPRDMGDAIGGAATPPRPAWRKRRGGQRTRAPDPLRPRGGRGTSPGPVRPRTPADHRRSRADAFGLPLGLQLRPHSADRAGWIGRPYR